MLPDNFSRSRWLDKPRRGYREAILAGGILLLSLVFVTPAAATNGMNMIGYGAVSTGMGGADLAAVDNASAMNINPAGICSCGGTQLITGLSVLQPKLRHGSATHRADGADKSFFLPLISYVAPLPKTGLTLGMGAFAQGGMGVEYDAIETPFLTTDQIYSDLSYLKITPTLGWQSADSRLKVGVGLHVGQVKLAVKNFPDTFVAGAFDGFRADDLEAFGYSLRLGFQYHFDRLVIGGSWSSKTDLEFRDGELVFASAPGLPAPAQLDGFNWPQQLGLGLMYTVTPRLRIAADVDWIEWSQAVDKAVLRGNGRSLLFDMNWNDQWVYAVGAEWEFATDLVLRLGYNHGDSPVPAENSSPLFPAIIEDHLTLGVGYSHFPWTLDLAYEHGFEKTLYNPLLGTEETHSQQTLHVMLTWLF